MTVSVIGDLDKLEELLTKATKGPWSLCPMGEYIFGGDGNMVADHHDGEIRMRGHGAEVSGQRPEGTQEHNAALIVAMRNTIDGLLAGYKARGEAIEQVILAASEVSTSIDSDPHYPDAAQDDCQLCRALDTAQNTLGKEFV